MQAIMLAAGMGRRMGRYTEACTKCMMQVGGRTLLERTVEALKEAEIERFIVVVGWEYEKLIDYIKRNISGIEIEFVYNYDYATTNNIYSLYLAREKLIEDDTILLESDLVYDKELIRQIVKSPEKNLVAVARYEYWMDGTVVTISNDGYIREFIDKQGFLFQNADNYYKTVNIYKFSTDFLKSQYIPFLEAYIKAYGQNQYYEMVLKALAPLAQARLRAFILQDIDWYEIDDVQDLDIANTIFGTKDQKLDLYARHFGGYWRFPHIKDFCYLVNPYFPTKKMLAQMKYFYESLLTQYPSGMSIQRMLVEKTFHISEDYVLVGNGAAELINALGQVLHGKMTIPIPAFNEYIRCFGKSKISYIHSEEYDFQWNVDALCNAATDTDVLVLVNPDNPSGSFLTYMELRCVLDVCKKNNTVCILDESFADFAESDKRYSLLSDEILEEYPMLVVVKSISKSYGVPGLRLGLLASANQALISQVQNALPIWNINSFGEYFLQIIALYANSYSLACDRLAEQRAKLATELQQISYLDVYPSQANYIMCGIKGEYSSKAVAMYLLDEHNILIKDLSSKNGFWGKQFIRIAVKDEVENQLLLQGLKCFEKSISRASVASTGIS